MDAAQGKGIENSRKLADASQNKGNHQMRKICICKRGICVPRLSKGAKTQEAYPATINIHGDPCFRLTIATKMPKLHVAVQTRTHVTQTGSIFACGYRNEFEWSQLVMAANKKRNKKILYDVASEEAASVQTLGQPTNGPESRFDGPLVYLTLLSIIMLQGVVFGTLYLLYRAVLYTVEFMPRNVLQVYRERIKKIVNGEE
ncbi:uncharacterized protein LOC107264338 [Cephus cinctus]|uniref:Uncharacterized protein LOC107264338 n=1 Tax=Cephus cinctus TaxID=211228 RepID=A0AAJ7VYG3_CEPCN|nr:uncharacterized protein LOC107264338 [Cephus cinctus]